VIQTNRWIAAFIGIFGNNAAEELERLKALSGVLNPVKKSVFGRNRSLWLEKMFRSCTGTEFENVIRFIALAIRKNCYRYIDTIIAGIEKEIDEQNGILDITMESAVETDRGFEEKLDKIICSQTGAAGIKLHNKLVPELLAGYRLRIGEIFVDASLRAQLENMKKDLLASEQTAADAASAG